MIEEHGRHAPTGYLGTDDRRAERASDTLEPELQV